METKSGWNSEYARGKFDVLIQEQDFLLLLRGNGIPVERAGEVTLEEKFQLMWLEGEILSLATKVRFYENEAHNAGREPDKDRAVSVVRAEHASVYQGRDLALAALKKRLDIDDGDGPAAAQS